MLFENLSTFTDLPLAVLDNEQFSSLDLRFARLMTQLAKTFSPDLFWAAALTSAQTRQGHVCLDLAHKAETVIKIKEQEYILPGLETWCKNLAQSSVVGSPGQTCPLILDNKNRLYLHRYWEHEAILAQKILDLTGTKAPDLEQIRLNQRLEEYFPKNPDLDIDWQKIAAQSALTNCFCVISGGPGTGKTTTIAKILALCLEFNPELHIALTAPTGKAAARLEESLQDSLSLFDPEIAQLLPEKASTIHRLLGAKKNSPNFYHNEQNPLNVDLVVVDEASMIDLPLLSKLVRALADQTRLILLGDQNQLAAVESGAAFADICAALSPALTDKSQTKPDLAVSDPKNPNTAPDKQFQNNIIHLRHSYRFNQKSGIYASTRAIQKKEIQKALASLKDRDYPDTEWIELAGPDNLKNVLKDLFLPYAQNLLRAANHEQAFKVLNSLRILTPLRQGPFGVKALNRLLQGILQSQALIAPGQSFYPGQPVMILENNYHLGLFNGDVGIIRKTLTGTAAVFPGLEEQFRFFSPQRLPVHETVFAMTVHKSQGSEFDNVLLILPDRDNPVLTRELIYTALTRAKNKVSIIGKEDIFELALKRKVKRFSGLKDALSSIAQH